MSTFDFRKPLDVSALADYAIRVPNDRYSKDTLLETLSREGRFPIAVNNWDALLDSLRDLSWIEARKIVMLHESLPLADEPAACRSYLNVLSTAVADWRTPRNSNILPAVKWRYVDHELMVIFPLEVKQQVETIAMEE